MSIIDLDNNVVALYPGSAAYAPGVILRQNVEDPYICSIIDKASLNLIVTNVDNRKFVIGSDGTVSFQAANWQAGRDQWVFQPVTNSGDFSSSGTTIQNNLQETSYLDTIDATTSAPYLSYSIYFPSSGNYDLWGYGYTSGSGIFWGFNGDTTHLRQLLLGDSSLGWERIPKWTKFSNLYIPEGGVYTFDVYLGDKNNVVMLDQWYFTTDTNFVDTLNEEDYTEPLPLSDAPYMTVLRLSSDDYSITTWLSSVHIPASGQYNYEIRNTGIDSGVNFVTPLTLEFWQIGGDKDNFAAWQYTFVDNSVGNTTISTDYGQTWDNIV
jgi:hypothetical protein